MLRLDAFWNYSVRHEIDDYMWWLVHHYRDSFRDGEVAKKVTWKQIISAKMNDKVILGLYLCEDELVSDQLKLSAHSEFALKSFNVSNHDNDTEPNNHQ